MPDRLQPDSVIRGVLHVDVAYDWGDEIDLVRAAQLAPSQAQDLGRRARTPASIGYRPPPQRFPLASLNIELPGVGQVESPVEVSVFDFGAVNVRIEVPLARTRDDWRHLAGDVAALQSIVRQAREAAEPLYTRLLPAVKAPAWREIGEEYFVFHFDPGSLPSADRLLENSADWLAGLLRSESGLLSNEEIADAVGRRISYSPDDLVLVDWAAAVVIDRECDETLRTIEFANLQLLEFRHLDRRLDDALARAYGLIHSLAGGRAPRFWRSQDRPLRVLGDIKIETDVLFERAGNGLKLVGDQYLARLYRLLAARFHLDEWADSIRSSLDVVESVYQILSDQASAGRIELMELIVIALIAVEIILTLVGH